MVSASYFTFRMSGNTSLNAVLIPLSPQRIFIVSLPFVLVSFARPFLGATVAPLSVDHMSDDYWDVPPSCTSAVQPREALGRCIVHFWVEHGSPVPLFFVSSWQTGLTNLEDNLLLFFGCEVILNICSSTFLSLVSQAEVHMSQWPPLSSVPTWSTQNPTPKRRTTDAQSHYYFQHHIDA